MAKKIIGEEAAEEIIEQSVNALQADLKASENDVRLAAKDVVLLAMDYEKSWKAAHGIASSLSDNQDPMKAIINFNKKMIVAKEQFEKMMELVFILQNKVNEFLGQRVQMVYTYISPKTGEVEIYKFDNDIGHIKVDKASKSHGGTLSGRINFTKSRMAELQRMNSNTEDDSTHLKATFSETYERYKLSKARLKMKGAFYIMWKEHDEWQKAFVSGAGVLGEAYFSFYINEYTFTTFIEEAVGDFITNPSYGAIQVDNASGFLQGDVSKNGIEYGVKARGASALGYSDIITYAQEMLAAPDLMEYLVGIDGKGGLKEKLREAGKVRLARVIDGKVEEDIEGLMEDYLVRGKGNIETKFSY